MKERVKIDTTILLCVIVATGFLFSAKKLYLSSILLDNVLDFFGVLFILDGVLMRMSARGHKKAHSQKSQSLVSTGPYGIVRNPMYLGSFLIGIGFVLVVWPWWVLPIFVWLFFARFNRQIVKEEQMLKKAFGKEYQVYCENVPRLIPNFRNLRSKGRGIFHFEEAFSTKEKRGLWTWPLLVFVLEILQGLIVFGRLDFQGTFLIFASAALTYAMGFAIFYFL